MAKAAVVTKKADLLAATYRDLKALAIEMALAYHFGYLYTAKRPRNSAVVAGGTADLTLALEPDTGLMNAAGVLIKGNFGDLDARGEVELIIAAFSTDNRAVDNTIVVSPTVGHNEYFEVLALFGCEYDGIRHPVCAFMRPAVVDPPVVGIDIAITANCDIDGLSLKAEAVSYGHEFYPELVFNAFAGQTPQQTPNQSSKWIWTPEKPIFQINR